VKTITSRQHGFVARCRAAAARKGVEDGVLLDGIHLVRDALSADVRLDVAGIATTALDGPEMAALLADLEASGVDVVALSGPVMDAASPVRTPSGIVAIARLAPAPLARALEGACPLVVAVVGVQDPGNVGAIIRAADAAGATGVVTCDGSASPFGWKALRGAMGSAFRLAVAHGHPAEMVLHEARARGLRSAATVPDGDTDVFESDLTAPCLVLVGGEGQGLGEMAGMADVRLRIPMAPGVESLNVAVATGVVLFEAYRQRAARGGARR
jgi:RNA methyltransferase, TrmH family